MNTTTENKKTVLLADDDNLVRSMVGSMLRKLKYRVLEAANGEDAYSKVLDDSESFDILLTDVVMPRMDGVALAEKVREADPEVPVIYISGFSRDFLEKEYGIRSDTEVLAKPFNIFTLKEKLEKFN